MIFPGKDNNPIERPLSYSATMGTILPPLTCALAILAVMTPRILAGGIAVFTLLVLASFGHALRQHKYNWRALILPALALVWFALSTLWSPSPRRFEMLRDTTYVTIFGALLLTTLPAWPAALARRSINWAMTGIVIAAIVFAQQYADDFSLTRWFSHLPPGGNLMMTNLPKRTACTLALLLWPLLLYVTQSVPARVAKITGGLLTLALLVLIYDLGSRSALLGALAGLMVFGLSQWRVQLGQAIGFVMLPLAVPLALLAAWLLPGLHPTLDHSGQERLAMWQETLHQLSWRGVGLDGSRGLSNLIQDHPHSIYLQWVLEGGLAGGILAIALAALLWQGLRRVAPALQPFIWAQATAGSLMLALAYGAWQGWWLAAHMVAAFLLALTAKGEDTSPHAPSADQR